MQFLNHSILSRSICVYLFHVFSSDQNVAKCKESRSASSCQESEKQGEEESHSRHNHSHSDFLYLLWNILHYTFSLRIVQSFDVVFLFELFNRPMSFGEFPILLITLNSVSNPFIYYIFITACRNAFTNSFVVDGVKFFLLSLQTIRNQ